MQIGFAEESKLSECVRADHVDMHQISSLVAITVLGNKGVGITREEGGACCEARVMYARTCHRVSHRGIKRYWP